MSSGAAVLKYFDKKADNNSEQLKEYKQKKNKRPPSSSSVNVTSRQSKFEFPTSNAATQKLLNNAVVDFLTESSCAFRVVDLPSFKEMFKISGSEIFNSIFQ